MNKNPLSEKMIPVAVMQAVFVIAALVSIIRKPLPMASKWKWIPLIFVNVVFPIGSIIYFAIGSESLDKKAAVLTKSYKY